jgi:uncharacterized membrane protein YobD (UPF0266 family)
VVILNALLTLNVIIFDHFLSEMRKGKFSLQLFHLQLTNQQTRVVILNLYQILLRHLTLSNFILSKKKTTVVYIAKGRT